MIGVEPNKWMVPGWLDLQWRFWGNELVVFNPASGQTHLLNLVAGEVLKRIVESPASLNEVMKRLSETTGIESSTEFVEHVRRLCSEFDELGLVKSAD